MAEDAATQKFIKPGSHKGKGIAVFTSGGDSQGMLYNLINYIFYFEIKYN